MMASHSKRIIFLAVVSFTAFFSQLLFADMKTQNIKLPDKVDTWTLSGPMRPINAGNIFEYMNGAGELYLGYGFDRLEVLEYGNGQENTILVELYFMSTPDDAFGLLSLDWSGEPILMGSTLQKTAFPPRALYGGGLLRVWTGSVFARVMTFRETESAKAAILALGHHIINDRGPTPMPALMNSFSEAAPQGWKLRRDRMGYFRSHLVLNSLYYLSHQNIFGLDPTAEAVTAPFERQSGHGSKERIQALLINYATHQKALIGLERFQATYLHDFQKEKPFLDHHGQIHYFQIEDGWLAFALNGTCLALVFECPNRAIAEQVLSGINYHAILN
jgi:hypothetical protein